MVLRRPARPAHRTAAHPGGRAGALSLAILLTLLATACGGGGDTTAVEEPTTADAAGASSSTIVTNEAGIDAIVDTWVQLGFSEDQARCLADQMNQMSARTTSSAADGAANQNLIEQMMKDCKIEDGSLKARLGG